VIKDIDLLRNWTDLRVTIPGGTFEGITGVTYVIGNPAANVPPTTNPPRTLTQYAITEFGEDPQRGITSSGVTINGRADTDLSYSFNSTFNIGLGTGFEFRTNVTNANVTNWVNTPPGVRAEIVSGGKARDPDVTIRFVGIPTWISNDPITATIPANVLTNLATGQQAGLPFTIESNNNFWNIEPALTRRAVLSNVAVGGTVDGLLDEEVFTMTITLTDTTFAGAIAGVDVGSFNDNEGNPNNPHALFYKRVAIPGPGDNFEFEQIYLDDYNVSATMRLVQHGSSTAVIDFRMLDDEEP
jgi:hypothetical protein